jgi:hypothetical protein
MVLSELVAISLMDSIKAALGMALDTVPIPQDQVREQAAETVQDSRMLRKSV